MKIHRAFTEYSGNSIQGELRELYSGNIQGTFREHSGSIQGTTFKDHSGNMQGTLTEHLWKIQVTTFSKQSANSIQSIFR